MTTIFHRPDDLTATVAADVLLTDFQRTLAERGQWLPVDPPGNPTVRAVLDGNLSGPRRYGYGLVREHVLGMKVRLTNGRVIKAGGQVVKNVAGYDLCRLFTGARGALGVIEEATFKLRPLPEAEQARRCSCASLAAAGERIEAILMSPLRPIVLDLVWPSTVVVGFAGAREDVEWQVAEACGLGFDQPAVLDHDQELPCRVSVLPSRLIPTLEELHPEQFVARAGNGVISFQKAGWQPPSVTEQPGLLILRRRLEEAFRG